jgi:hypothetical protein
MGRRDRAGAILLPLLVLALLAGCGSETAKDGAPDSDATSTASAAPVAMTGGDVQVSCGGSPPGWPASVMAEGLPGVLTDAEARALFQRMVDDPRWGGEPQMSFFKDGIDVEWRVLAVDDTNLTVGLGAWTDQGPVEPDRYALVAEREQGRWMIRGGGTCNLAPVLEPGNTWVEVTGYEASSAGASDLVATVNERECTGSRDPEPYLHAPFVIETEAEVTLYWTSTPPRGYNTCPGNPSVQRTITLETPLGNRALLDGSTYPPTPVRPG